MAVFILKKSEKRIKQSKLDSLMEQKELSKFQRLSIGDHELQVFQSPRDKRKWKFSHDGTNVFVFGTLVYREKYSGEAAILLLTDLKNQQLRRWELNGSFCLIEHSRNGLRIVLDSQGIYQLYSSDKNELLSNSFLAQQKLLESTEPDKLAIQANLLLGFIPYPDTMFREIKRIQQEDSFFNIVLERYGVQPENPVLNTYSDHLEYQSDKLAAYKDNVKSLLTNEGMEIGVSGGYDSRLILALFHNSGIPIHAHTHHKNNDPDPLLAREICQLLGIPLDEKKDRPVFQSEEDFYSLMESSMLQFDGRICSMMQYAKFEYSREYRDEVFQPGYCIVSGVGGEIYRNHNYFNKSSISTDLWIRYYLINYQGWRSLKTKGRYEFMHYLKAFLIRELGIMNHVDYEGSKQYYKDIWLRDWHGLRNSAENIYNYHLSPFADHTIANPSVLSSSQHGTLGQFEIDLIGRFSRALLNVNSVYGFKFNKLPIKEKLKEMLKTSIPVELKFQLKKRMSANIRNLKIIDTNPVARKNIQALKDLDLDLNIDLFISNQDRFDLANSIGFAIRRLS